MAVTLPGWDSVDAAVAWHRGFEIAGFVALGLLLAFEVLAYIYGNRKDVLLAAQARTAERQAEQQTADLKARLEPRTLSSEQQEQISSYLDQHPKGRFVIKASSSADDAAAYAQQIAGIFGAKGWTVVRIDNAIFAGTNVGGLWATGKHPGPAPATIQTLVSAFGAAHIPVRGEADAALPEEVDGFWLSIGHK
jgi:hypothetical protein